MAAKPANATPIPINAPVANLDAFSILEISLPALSACFSILSSSPLTCLNSAIALSAKALISMMAGGKKLAIIYYLPIDVF